MLDTVKKSELQTSNQSIQVQKTFAVKTLLPILCKRSSIVIDRSEELNHRKALNDLHKRLTSKRRTTKSVSFFRSIFFR